MMEEILAAYHFTAERYIENDGSVTLSLVEIDIIEHGKEEAEARFLLGNAILEYAMDWRNPNFWICPKIPTLKKSKLSCRCADKYSILQEKSLDFFLFILQSIMIELEVIK